MFRAPARGAKASLAGGAAGLVAVGVLPPGGPPPAKPTPDPATDPEQAVPVAKTSASPATASLARPPPASACTDIPDLPSPPTTRSRHPGTPAATWNPALTRSDARRGRVVAAGSERTRPGGPEHAVSARLD